MFSGTFIFRAVLEIGLVLLRILKLFRTGMVTSVYFF